ncbi:hypothetical protein N656DRAFT_261014 [Canariomyces notabilis]|uniref:Uncharacterized protein n=1 Tax=Canariomyces notabilis TaxID=2074819 RepID=A0AAN6TLG5_9PEZI|nr:hypothetical protein N656DRAFT_261014 [Canariomyces arenarius]
MTRVYMCQLGICPCTVCVCCGLLFMSTWEWAGSVGMWNVTPEVRIAGRFVAVLTCCVYVCLSCRADFLEETGCLVQRYILAYGRNTTDKGG